MIYSCQHCGAKFTAKELNDAISSKKSFLQCKYCANVNDMGDMKSSHTAKGYDCLEKGDFYNAEMEFNEALKPAQKVDLGAKSAYIDAYLGQALAKFSVQVIYSDEFSDKDEFPQINCYMVNDDRFEDDYDIQVAYEIAKHIMDDSNRALELNRLNRFVSIIDGIKNAYDKQASRGDKYQLFVAYEDKSQDYASSFSTANKIRNEMPSKINKIFLPNIDDYVTDVDYEGAILYAIHNSNCMLVVTDNDIDSRLMSIYSRFYWAMVNIQDKFAKKELGFVRYKNKIQIHLPDHKVSNNVFEIDDLHSYISLVHKANNIIYEVPGRGGPVNVVKPEEEIASIIDVDTSDGAPIINGNVCRFGSYPQRLERNIEIINVFKALPKPTMDAENGWNVMFASKSGKPYTWYLDKEIKGKKYRAVYFLRFREVFSLRETDIKPSVQRLSKYMPMSIHVFAYEPIEWGVLDMSMNTAVLVSSVGLDSREFNNNEASPDWDASTIKAWLNYEFYEVAFSEKEKQFLFERDDEYVSLIDREKDFSKHYRMQKIANFNITGSDYFKCIGGFSDRNVGNFWVKSENYGFDGKAVALQPHSVVDASPQYVDTTTVSVVPKIIVRF